MRPRQPSSRRRWRHLGGRAQGLSCLRWASSTPGPGSSPCRRKKSDAIHRWRRRGGTPTPWASTSLTPSLSPAPATRTGRGDIPRHSFTLTVSDAQILDAQARLAAGSGVFTDLPEQRPSPTDEAAGGPQARPRAMAVVLATGMDSGCRRPAEKCGFLFPSSPAQAVKLT